MYSSCPAALLWRRSELGNQSPGVGADLKNCCCIFGDLVCDVRTVVTCLLFSLLKEMMIHSGKMCHRSHLTVRFKLRPPLHKLLNPLAPYLIISVDFHLSFLAFKQLLYCFERVFMPSDFLQVLDRVLLVNCSPELMRSCK